MFAPVLRSTSCSLSTELQVLTHIKHTLFHLAAQILSPMFQSVSCVLMFAPQSGNFNSAVCAYSDNEGNSDSVLIQDILSATENINIKK